MKRVISIFMLTAALLTAAPTFAFAAQGSVILALKLDAGCVKAAAQQRDRTTNQAYVVFRKATEKARSDRKEALVIADKDRAKKKQVEKDYRSALAKAGADLNTSKKNITAMFKAQVGLCKK